MSKNLKDFRSNLPIGIRNFDSDRLLCNKRFRCRQIDSPREIGIFSTFWPENAIWHSEIHGLVDFADWCAIILFLPIKRSKFFSYFSTIWLWISCLQAISNVVPLLLDSSFLFWWIRIRPDWALGKCRWRGGQDTRRFASPSLGNSRSAI